MTGRTTRTRPVPTARALVLVVSMGAVTCASGTPDLRAPLHLRVGPLPPCEYGLTWEQPLVLELRDAGGAVAQVRVAGVDMGEASRFASLYVSDARAGTWELAFGRCPPLRPDLAASVACDPVDFFDRMRVHAVPRGWTEPVTVTPIWFRARCVPRLTAEEE
jgi:hypothetical protein